MQAKRHWSHMRCGLVSRFPAAVRIARKACGIVAIGLSVTIHATEQLPTYGQDSNRLPMARGIPNPAAADTVWAGVLEKQPIYMHAPRELRELDQRPDQVTLWRFQAGTTDSIRALFERAELPSRTLKAL